VDTILVSVVIPVYNGALFIKECINSVLNQSYKDFEVIVINDGSTDETLDILNELAQNDLRIKITTIENSGRAKARNIGITLSNGTWIAFLDADDAWKSNKLEKQLQEAKEVNADFIYSERTWVNKFSEKVEQPKKYKLPSGNIFEDLIVGNYICTSTSLMKKSILLDEKGFNESATFTNVQDYELWLRISCGKKFLALPDELCLYRLHENNAHKNVVNRFIGLFGCIDTMRKLLKKNPQDNVNKLEGKIQERELEIANMFASSLFHVKAYNECLLALSVISNNSKLTFKQWIFKIVCYILSSK
jgi:glycosyltransferase involved in cell wall biosynthesis